MALTANILEADQTDRSCTRYKSGGTFLGGESHLAEELARGDPEDYFF